MPRYSSKWIEVRAAHAPEKTHQPDSQVPNVPGLQPQSWMGKILLAAAVCNIAWGTFAILSPLTLFRWCGLDPLPIYPELWQCVGMIVGVYGVGYAIAASDPFRHWTIVLVGLLGKIFGTVGFIGSVISGRLPLAMGWTIVTNDLIWWIPFGLILRNALQSNRAMSVQRSGQLCGNELLRPQTRLSQTRFHELDSYCGVVGAGLDSDDHHLSLPRRRMSPCDAEPHSGCGRSA